MNRIQCRSSGSGVYGLVPRLTNSGYLFREVKLLALNQLVIDSLHNHITNVFSKKAEMLAYSVAITFFYHNFVRKHQTLRMPPALKHGVASHVWSISDMVKLADEAELDRKAS